MASRSASSIPSAGECMAPAAALFRGLSDPAQLAILQRLTEGEGPRHDLQGK
ncbi:hypothetical protein [Mycolicibacterium sp. CR10]|uniref:hypothetical protein n=1 Tax=Mycolicibacterium sp. CR10 TaxID=2562314 RepID=UPI001F0ECC8C|nr:hypothetical protein [Mycolicibacterium sp. CR10]